MGGLFGGGGGGGGQRLCWPPLKLLGGGCPPLSSYAYGDWFCVMLKVCYIRIDVYNRSKMFGYNATPFNSGSVCCQSVVASHFGPKTTAYSRLSPAITDQKRLLTTSHILSVKKVLNGVTVY